MINFCCEKSQLTAFGLVVVILLYVQMGAAVGVFPNFNPFFSWTTSSSGWSGASLKSSNKAIFVAIGPTGSGQIMLVDSNPTDPAVLDSALISAPATAVVPFDNQNLAYFIGGTPLASCAIDSRGQVVGTASMGTRTGATPAAAAFPPEVYFAGGEWPTFSTGAAFSRVTYSGSIFSIFPTEPCSTDTLAPRFAAGYFSVGVSTNETLLFTRGCNESIDFSVVNMYRKQCLNPHSSDDVLLFRPNLNSCPVIAGTPVSAISFNFTAKRCRVGAAASTQYVVFAGGELENGTISGEITVFSVAALDNVTIGQDAPPVEGNVFKLSQPRRSPTVVVASDRYFFFLGGDTAAGASNVVDVLDTFDWSMNTTSLMYAAALLTATEDPRIPNSIIYIGGYEPSGTSAGDHFKMYRISAIPDGATNTPSGTAASPSPTQTAVTPAPTVTQPTSVSPTSTSTSSTGSTSPSTTSPSSSSTSTPPPTPAPTAPGGCTFPPPTANAQCDSTGTWVVLGNTTITNANITSPVRVNGTLDISSIDTVIRIQPIPGQIPITVTDDASIRGVIELRVTNVTGANVTVLTARNVTGSFSGVKVISDDPKVCKKGVLDQSTTRVGVLLSDCKKKMKWWIPFLIVIGCLLFVLFAIVLGLVAMRKGWAKGLYRSRVDTQRTSQQGYRLLGEEKK